MVAVRTLLQILSIHVTILMFKPTVWKERLIDLRNVSSDRCSHSRPWSEKYKQLTQSLPRIISKMRGVCISCQSQTLHRRIIPMRRLEVETKVIFS